MISNTYFILDQQRLRLSRHGIGTLCKIDFRSRTSHMEGIEGKRLTYRRIGETYNA
jgi:hypothetical protein